MNDSSSAGSILLVEDDDRVARAIKKKLPREMDVVHVRTRRQAFREINADPAPDFRLMLFDLHLGRDHAGGFAALAAARKKFPRVTRAIVSGYVDTRATDIAGRHGAHAIAKPFEDGRFEWLFDLARKPVEPSLTLGEHAAQTARAWRLSPMQSRVFAEFVVGKTHAEVAATLGIKINTLRYHVGHILDRAYRAGVVGADTIEHLVSFVLRDVIARRQRC